MPKDPIEPGPIGIGGPAHGDTSAKELAATHDIVQLTGIAGRSSELTGITGKTSDLDLIEGVA